MIYGFLQGMFQVCYIASKKVQIKQSKIRKRRKEK